MSDKTLQPSYRCDCCDYTCSRKSDYAKHILSKKHSITYKCLHNGSEKSQKKYMCECGKEYKFRQSLHTHNKVCIIKNNNYIVNDNNANIDSSFNDIKLLTNLVLDVVKSNNELQKQNQDFQKQNQELQKQVLEICKNGMNINHINSHNKTFNLQFFLNEECKDAMNLQDFVESVQLQMTDLEKIGELGYVEGVSKFIMGKLNETEIHKRPVHCSDAKRETLYVKDDNVWTKEGAENVKIRGAVKKIEKKNIRLLNAWKETHAGCMDSDSPYNDQYTHMIIGSLGGCEPDNVNKVIKKIAKATIIDK